MKSGIFWSFFSFLSFFFLGGEKLVGIYKCFFNYHTRLCQVFNSSSYLRSGNFVLYRFHLLLFPFNYKRVQRSSMRKEKTEVAWYFLSRLFLFWFTQVYEVESFATETGGTPEPRPFFEDPESNITVQLGAQVYMHCRVQNLQDTLKVNSHFSSFLDISFHWSCILPSCITCIISQCIQRDAFSDVSPRI